jgi:outer membrane protein TolC
MTRPLLLIVLPLLACGCALTPADVCQNIILPEQRYLDHRDSERLPKLPLPPVPAPRTVSDPQPDTPDWQLSLDDAIRIALVNCRVVRTLTGVTATFSGRTIYDAPIANTTIDQERARFDPVLHDNNSWSRTNTPFGVRDPNDPNRSLITSQPVDTYASDLGVSKTNVLGGQTSLNWTDSDSRFPGATLPLNPQESGAVTLSYTQPLLQGGGYAVNTAPIVIARINTERSFFEYKDSVQELVRGVIEAYWTLVQARLVLWSRGIQVLQSREAFEREKARLGAGFGDAGTLAQARVTYSQFRASQIAAEADVLAREGALRNLLYLPPSDGRRIIPVTPPASRRLQPNWEAAVRLAEQRRPDIIELKLVLEADRERLIMADNQALPKLDAVALYRWNGLSGEMPNGERISTRTGQYTDWQVGVNFSVPLGLRQGRAQVREQRLTILRDQAILEQALHAAVHDLAVNNRDLDSAYEQYLAYRDTRAAADINLRAQTEKFKAGQTIYLNVLQALNDWGNAVQQESLQLLSYNVLLAGLERQTGTILETHGLIFAEERFRAAGPIPCRQREYPSETPPKGAPHRYGSTNEPAEEAFDLKNPATREPKPPE